MRIIYTVYKTKDEATAAMGKMIRSNEIHEMEFPFVAKSQQDWSTYPTKYPWAIWISP